MLSVKIYFSMTICWPLKLNGNYNTSQFKDFKKSLKIPMG